MSKEYRKPSNMLHPVSAVIANCGREGETPNIITAAWTGTTCSDPVMVSISVRKGRFSCNIIRDTGEFVINLMGKRLVRAVDYCSAESGGNADRLEETRLIPRVSKYMKASGVEENPVNTERKMVEVRELGGHNMFITKVMGMTTDNRYMGDRGKFNLNMFRFVSYSHGEYFEPGKRLGDLGYSVERPVKR